MEKSYFIIENGKQSGPYVRGELVYHSIRPETYVWREGLDNWVTAGSLPELDDILINAASAEQNMRTPYEDPTPRQEYNFNGYGQPNRNGYGNYGKPDSYGRQGYRREPYYGEPIPHTNWQPWAIVATVAGFLTTCIALILGIIAIVKANKANRYYSEGHAELGDQANSTAKTLVIISFVLIGISLLSTVYLFSTGNADSLLRVVDMLN